MRAISESMVIEFDLVDGGGNVCFTTYDPDAIVWERAKRSGSRVVMRAWSRHENEPPTPTIDISAVIERAIAYGRG